MVQQLSNIFSLTVYITLDSSPPSSPSSPPCRSATARARRRGARVAAALRRRARARQPDARELPPSLVHAGAPELAGLMPARADAPTPALTPPPSRQRRHACTAPRALLRQLEPGVPASPATAQARSSFPPAAENVKVLQTLASKRPQSMEIRWGCSPQLTLKKIKSIATHLKSESIQKQISAPSGAKSFPNVIACIHFVCSLKS